MTPYAKTGGLGDVVGALASAMRARGHEVTCCVPYYRSAQEYFEGEPAAPAFAEASTFAKAAADKSARPAGAKAVGLTLNIPLGSRTVSGEVWEWTQADGVRVLFVRRDEFFDRTELYDVGGRAYDDNAERFLFFAKAVVELARHTRYRADVVHCHDWQAAFVPVQMTYQTQRGMAAERAGRPQPWSAAPPVKTLLTIHNVAYQGIFWSLDFPLTNLPREYFTMGTLEYYGQMNLLKGGIVFADSISTVSPTYAEEIVTAGGGFGLEGVLATRTKDLHGIVNGVDYGRWDPETDPHLRSRYGREELGGKRACREDLLTKMRLDAGDRQPVAGFVSRLTAQKGVEILAGALKGLVRMGVRVAILGKGEAEYESMLTEVARRYPGRVSVRIGHDEELAHQIQGGADMLLVPSQYEPCGLTQLYAMKYGTIPVVRATGGLDDTVQAYDARTGRGTGFKFAAYTAEALTGAVRRAIMLYKQPRKWEKLMREAMAGDFSWPASAREYEKLYAAVVHAASK